MTINKTHTDIFISKGDDIERSIRISGDDALLALLNDKTKKASDIDSDKDGKISYAEFTNTLGSATIEDEKKLNALYTKLFSGGISTQELDKIAADYHKENPNHELPLLSQIVTAFENNG